MKTALALALSLLALPAWAADHVVEMRNAGAGGERMVFEPSFVRASVGDTITFRSADAGHAVASVIVPTGADAFDGNLDEATTVTVTKPGAYLFKSKPHFAVGMIGLLVVDSPDANRGDIDAFRPRGKLMRDRFEALRGQL